MFVYIRFTDVFELMKVTASLWRVRPMVYPLWSLLTMLIQAIRAAGEFVKV